jgi:hypothetical protein
MREYREKIESENSKKRSSQDAGTGATARARDRLANLFTDFGLEDMATTPVCDSSQGEQTVEQEFRAYTAQLSDIPILKFWEVCGDVNGA